jgi:Cu-processing system ATP-binding protein
MIEIKGLAKRFGALDVLRSVDLSIRRGHVTAIVGPNAAGKTTLIKMILGLTRPDAGAILLDGRDIVGDGDAYRERIGYMPQAPRLPENLTGAEVLAMLRDLRGPGATVDESLIDRFALRPELQKKLRTLSGGTRQKVNAVAAFLFRPDLLILDEPTAGLDPVASGVFKDRVREARAAGATFIVTSHIMSELEELADDVVFLVDGNVRFAGPLAELKVVTRQDNLERAVAEMMTRGAAA